MHERWTYGVLEWITDSIADDRRFVRVRFLTTVLICPDELMVLVVRGLAYGLVEGLVVCAGAVGLMVWYLIRGFRES